MSHDILPQHNLDSTAITTMSLSQKPAGSPPRVSNPTAAEPASRTVPRPVPPSQVEDPRRYQIDQIRRRFSPKETAMPDGSTSLAFKLKPSDPDFPFELAHLDCELHVPQAYPAKRPTLSVRNKDIPRGFSINVERGWDKLASEKRSATLLALTRSLDNNLEMFLSEQKVDTVKFVGFQGVKDTRHLESAQSPSQPVSSTPVGSSTAAAPAPAQPRRTFIPEPSYTKDQIAEARDRRAREVRQLEARMGRLPMFRRSADGIVFTLPIEPGRRAELPQGLKSVVSVHLIVPLLYPLQDLRIQLNEAASEDAEPVEELFTKRCTANKNMTLMSHVNYLSQNLHVLAAQAQAQKAKVEDIPVPPAPEQPPRNLEPKPSTGTPALQGKGHVQFIPRPPEWEIIHGEEESSSDSFDSDDAGGAALGESGEEDEAPAMPVEETAERGTMISFPSVELYGIELLQVSILGLAVKCERCKTVNEFKGLKPGQEKTDSCKKCTAPMAAKFRQQIIHEHSTRGGFIDLAGCKVLDMLPSSFIPTCSRCSTPGPELVSVRGESITNVCRECHNKFTFKIPEIRFLLMTTETLSTPNMMPRRRREEKLGVRAGEQLPNRGACIHYRKSYRWFRFSCCSRVHACDKCHDNDEDHINEWANRMICGWCSREQNYNPEACTFCGRSVIGRKGRGFWEGGKGTRDQRFMSRKDPRKYRKKLGAVSG